MHSHSAKMATGGETEKGHFIGKLTGPQNWMAWKVQIRHILRCRGQWEFAMGTAELKNDANAAEKQKFEQRKCETMATISCSVGTSQVHLIQNIDDPDKAWTALKSRFEKNTIVAKLKLREKYVTNKLSDGGDVEKHLQEMKEMVDRLGSMGYEQSQEEQIMTLLASLPRSYRPLVIALGAQISSVTVAHVENSILDEDMRDPDDVQDNDQAFTGNAMNGSRPPGRGHAVAFRGHGFRTSDPRGGGHRQDKSRLECFNCGLKGHFSYECHVPRKSRNPSRGGRPNYRHRHRAKVADVNDDADDEFMFMGEVTAHTAGKEKCDGWIVDIGASAHMSWDRSLFTNYNTLLPRKLLVKLGDGRCVSAIAEGEIKMRLFLADGRKTLITFTHVLHVPNLSSNLLSVCQITKKKFTMAFNDEECSILTPKGRTIGKGKRHGNLYILVGKVIVPQVDYLVDHQAASVAIESERDLWHYRLGHIGERMLARMTDPKVATGVKFNENDKLSFCDACASGKTHRSTPKAIGEIRSTRRLQLVHSDVCGPVNVPSVNKSRYVITFIDDFTRHVDTYLMAHKDEALDMFKLYLAKATAETGERMGILFTDNGGEYKCEGFRKFLREKQIHHNTTCPYTPESNGIAERMNRTLLEKARSMLTHSNLDRKYWGEAVNTAVHLTNRMPTSALGGKITPHEKWTGRTPDLGHVRVFGSVCYANTPTVGRRQLDARARKCVFVGYSRGTAWISVDRRRGHETYHS